MNKLFNVLDSIINANEFGHQDTISALNNLDEIYAHAENMGVSINQTEAEKIGKVGLEWINKVENGNGEWSLYRDEAKQELESDGEPLYAHPIPKYQGSLDSSESKKLPTIRCNDCWWHGNEDDLVLAVAADYPDDEPAKVCPSCKKLGCLMDLDIPDGEPKFLMNPHTGSVDTAENWAAEGYTPENSELIEVVKVNGDWVEAE